MRRGLAFFLALFLCLSCCAAAWAQESEDAAAEEADAEELSEPLADTADGEAASEEASGEMVFDLDALEDSPDINLLTESNFAADDIPEDRLEKCAHPGRVEKEYYTPTDGSEDVKSFMVYLPNGYDESGEEYNVLYLLHAANGTPKNYLDPDKATNLQCLLDNMIENGELEPLIVVAATYYPAEGFMQYLPLNMQVEVASTFPRELVEDIVPLVEGEYRAYGSADSLEGIVASREHRGIAGFSLGGTATWYVFLQQMQAFKWFLPISEASWDDGEGGTSGIWDSDVSAQVLYDAVLAQGFKKEDFRLYVATGTEDEAFDVSTSQMVSLLEYADVFKPGENTSCSMMIGGTHTLKAVYTYLYHILPTLFLGQ